MPLRFLQSRACAELSPHALKLFIDLMSMLKPNAGQNGDIWPSAEALTVRGWASEATRTAAMRELREAGLVVSTRRRRGRKCELVALTLWPLACDHKKLDHIRVHHQTTDYRGANDQLLAPPTTERPAQWRKTRAASVEKIGAFRCGSEKPTDLPQRESETAERVSMPPVAGGVQPKLPA